MRLGEGYKFHRLRQFEEATARHELLELLPGYRFMFVGEVKGATHQLEKGFGLANDF